MNEMELNILTPEKRFFNGKVSELVIKGEGGYMGILPGHTPLVMAMIPHVATLKIDNESKQIFISTGLVSLANDKIDIVCEACEWPKDIDKIRAEKSKERAEERLKDKKDNLDMKRAQYSLIRALARLQIAE